MPKNTPKNIMNPPTLPMLPETFILPIKIRLAIKYTGAINIKDNTMLPMIVGIR